jgi:hypothetical protein
MGNILIEFFRKIQYHLEETIGDLFNAPKKFSLGNCISEDLKLSAGIAKKFRNLFGNIDLLSKQGPVVGGVVYQFTGTRFIYYLVTKKVQCLTINY